MLPDAPGTYALLLRLLRPTVVGVGRLGRFHLAAGWYVYVGSALGPGGLAARVGRHLRREKRLHWHVDYLLAVAPVVAVWYAVGRERRECAWARSLAARPGAILPVRGFGASDCHCPAHLFYFAARPTRDLLSRAARVPLSEERIMPEPFEVFLECIAAGDDERTEEAALAVGRVGEAAVEPLRRLLAAGDADQRWWAVRALAAVGGPAARETLVAALDDPDADVRACAAQGLGELQAPEAVTALVRRLADPSPFVSRLASDALSRIGEPAVSALIAALGAPESPVRAGAARALSIIQPEGAIPALYAALDDPSVLVSHYADEALERMGVGLVLFRP